MIGARSQEEEIVGYTADETPMYRYSDNNPIRGSKGDFEAMALYAGQSAGLIKNQLKAKEIISETIAVAKKVLEGLRAFH